MEVQRLLDLGELAEVLGRNPETIKKDLRRNPDAVPPRLQLPGTRLLRWRAVDVERWLAGHVMHDDRAQRSLP
jgi:predicted DNA-binding transcriptional regulator AlpA